MGKKAAAKKAAKAKKVAAVKAKKTAKAKKAAAAKAKKASKKKPSQKAKVLKKKAKKPVKKAKKLIELMPDSMSIPVVCAFSCALAFALLQFRRGVADSSKESLLS